MNIYLELTSILTQRTNNPILVNMENSTKSTTKDIIKGTTKEATKGTTKDAAKGTTKKIKRATNFTAEEMSNLIDLVLNHLESIENKNNLPTVWSEKAKAWKTITEQFNSNKSHLQRPTKALKLKYEKMKCMLRKKMLQSKTEPVSYTDYEEKLLCGLQGPDEESYVIEYANCGSPTEQPVSVVPGENKRKRSVESTSSHEEEELILNANKRIKLEPMDELTELQFQEAKMDLEIKEAELRLVRKQMRYEKLMHEIRMKVLIFDHEDKW